MILRDALATDFGRRKSRSGGTALCSKYQRLLQHTVVRLSAQPDTSRTNDRNKSAVHAGILKLVIYISVTSRSVWSKHQHRTCRHVNYSACSTGYPVCSRVTIPEEQDTVINDVRAPFAIDIHRSSTTFEAIRNWASLTLRGIRLFSSCML